MNNTEMGTGASAKLDLTAHRTAPAPDRVWVTLHGLPGVAPRFKNQAEATFAAALLAQFGSVAEAAAAHAAYTAAPPGFMVPPELVQPFECWFKAERVAWAAAFADWPIRPDGAVYFGVVFHEEGTVPSMDDSTVSAMLEHVKVTVRGLDCDAAVKLKAEQAYARTLLRRFASVSDAAASQAATKKSSEFPTAERLRLLRAWVAAEEHAERTACTVLGLESLHGRARFRVQFSTAAREPGQQGLSTRDKLREYREAGPGTRKRQPLQAIGDCVTVQLHRVEGELVAKR